MVFLEYTEDSADRTCRYKKKFQFSGVKVRVVFLKLLAGFAFVQTFHDFSQLLTNRTFWNLSLLKFPVYKQFFSALKKRAIF